MKQNYWEVSWEEKASKMVQFELKVDHIKLKTEQ